MLNEKDRPKPKLFNEGSIGGNEGSKLFNWRQEKEKLGIWMKDTPPPFYYWDEK